MCVSALSVGLQLAFFTVLLLLIPTPVCPSHPKPDETHHVSPRCCMSVSKATINEPFSSCVEQMGDQPWCNVHAYYFTSWWGGNWCVDPTASWLPDRLRKLEAKGIYCQIR